MQLNTGLFLNSLPEVEAAKVVLFGVPMDYTVCFRPGARFGPMHIRQASYGLEHYSMRYGDTLHNRRFFDAGDLVLPFGNAAVSLAQVRAFVRDVVMAGRHPFLLGGEHLVSLPAIHSVFEQYPNLHVLHFDAHADLADTYFGESVTHATVMRRVLDFLPHTQFHQFGIRSADLPEVEFARTAGLDHHPYEILQPLRNSLAALPQDTPLYVSLDIDVFDPAFAPGTGTPEAGGIMPNDWFNALDVLRGRRIVGADVVEVAPQLDPTGCTAVLAAKMVREMMITLFEEGTR